MPATSEKQRRYFAWVAHHPNQARAEGKYPEGMTTGQMHDFAATPEKGLPKVKYGIRKSAKPAVPGKYNLK